jgi:excisionase family DNA binding protein
METLMIETTDEQYLTPQEACAYLGISKATLANYVKRGLINRYEKVVPRQTLYKKSELDSLKQIRPKE